MDGAEAEGGQELVRVELDGAAQQLLGGGAVAPLVEHHAAVDQRLEVVRLRLQDAPEVAQRLLALAPR